METLQAIFTRKSTRSFSDRPVEDGKIRTILRAGMSGPSCRNTRDWSFLVVRDRDTLNAMADINGTVAEPLRRAAFGILVLGDYERAHSEAKDYWVIDGAIAAENMILAAHGMGIGSVWLGTWPRPERVDGQRKLFHLPEDAIPHSIIAFGYPKETEQYPERDLYDESRVHYDRW